MSETTADGRGASSGNIPTTGGAPRSTNALDPAEEYKMDHKQRGLALIFNQEEFHWRQGLSDRKGSSVDRDRLVERLTQLNFEVKFYDNCKKKKAQATIKKAAQEDHSDRDCFLLVFMSHGDGDLVNAYDGKLSIKETVEDFKGDKCPSLVGKPKIFIFQACRGNRRDDAVTPASSTDNEPEQEVEEDSGVQTLPAGADFLMCYSAAEGYCSFRSTAKGSWYIQDLCELLQDHGNSLEFTELLMLVNRQVSTRTAPNGKKQVPCFASMLRKKLYFRPKESQT